MYQGMVRKEEVRDLLKGGAELKFRVTGVKEDGKLDLSIRKEAYLQMDEDCEIILKLLRESPDKSLPFGDKSDPEEIRKHLHMGKNQYKRAIGRLYKERLITMEKEKYHTGIANERDRSIGRSAQGKVRQGVHAPRG